MSSGGKTKLLKKKKVKGRCIQHGQFLLFKHSVILPWCIQALAFIELPVNNVNSQSFNVSLAVHQFV
jgi:hypothetical protein